jgi:antitoxin ParD1/3/4
LVGIIRTGETMSSIDKISIALPHEMVVSLRQAVDTGEVVREALRDWSHKRQLQQNGVEELRRVWQAARHRNGPYVSADEVMDRLEHKYQAIADAADGTD